ncbi:hypothetical protein M2271_008543, partial [Streptomyces sp. LBL]|nr:hypothetical protein [Streptomyces sp. LBL]
LAAVLRIVGHERASDFMGSAVRVNLVPTGAT